VNNREKQLIAAVEKAFKECGYWKANRVDVTKAKKELESKSIKFDRAHLDLIFRRKRGRLTTERVFQLSELLNHSFIITPTDVISIEGEPETLEEILEAKEEINKLLKTIKGLSIENKNVVKNLINTLGYDRKHEREILTKILEVFNNGFKDAGNAKERRKKEEAKKVGAGGA